MPALTMQSVGTKLREARIKKGYTLDDINARTRISLKNLNAIESDDLAKISSPFTYRSFVKQVADMVGLDHATLAADAQEASSTMPEVLVPGQEDEVYVRPHQFQQQTKPKPTWNWARTASIAILVCAVSVYLIWRNGGIEAAKLPPSAFPSGSRVVTPEQPAPATVQPLPQPASQPVMLPVADQQPQPPAMQAAAPSAEPPAPGTEQLLPPAQESVAQSPAPRDAGVKTIHIELSAIQPTWLSISADGKTTYSGTLAAMHTMTFDSKETAQIKTANAGGVNIIFNGRALGSLGRRGQSRTFVFTKSGYEVVQGVGNNALARISPSGE